MTMHRLLMALGGTDSKIRLFTLSNEKLHQVCTLKGHEDWIRGLVFHEHSNEKLLLAAASQDR